VYTNDVEEQVLFIVKVFTLQGVAIALQDNVSEMTVYFNMSSHYIINEVNAKSVVVTPRGNEIVQVTNVDQVTYSMKLPLCLVVI
jgi:hypothetical protein